MTLDQWLQEATGTFPRGVRKRLEKEYQTHLADSILAGGSGDAFELFGDPRKIRKSLKKLYIEEKQLRTVRKQTGLRFWVFFILAASFLFIRIKTHSGITQTLMFTFTIIAFIYIWKYSINWQEERQVMFRNTLSSVFFPFISFINMTAHMTLFSYFVGVFLLIALGMEVKNSFLNDVRMRRTLELEHTRQ